MSEKFGVTPELPEEDLTGLDECFHSAAREHGRALVELILRAGMAQEAARVLGTELTARGSREGLTALAIFGDNFNKVSQAYANSQGWTAKDLDECSAEVEQALAQRVVLARTPKIILAH